VKNFFTSLDLLDLLVLQYTCIDFFPNRTFCEPNQKFARTYTELACPELNIFSGIMSLHKWVPGSVTPTENLISERTQPIQALSNFSFGFIFFLFGYDNRCHCGFIHYFEVQQNRGKKQIIFIFFLNHIFKREANSC
jgi:hypothetical protein